MILLIILMIIGLAIVYSLPLYVAINVVLWLFKIHFRITLIQAIGIGFLISVIQSYFISNNDKEKQ